MTGFAPPNVQLLPVASVNERAANTPTPSMIWKLMPAITPTPAGRMSMFITRMRPVTESKSSLSAVTSPVTSPVTSENRAGVSPFDGANSRQCGVAPPQPFAHVTRVLQPTRSVPSHAFDAHEPSLGAASASPGRSQRPAAEHNRPLGQSRCSVHGAPGVGDGL
ncbi:MAG: hypothetical protein M3680_26395 [Myxococcota bacterium]|nr:hypothetical protein [Myxococcota bacterium]